MGTPASWSAPASLPQVAIFSAWNTVTYANGYWFSLTHDATDARLRYATSLTGTWTEATLPAAPGGYTSGGYPSWGHGVVYGNGKWAFCLGYYDGSSEATGRIIHATDPTGTWSAHDYGSSGTLYEPQVFAYLDGNFIVGGRYDSGAPSPAWIGYCASADGTYTLSSAAADTGYSHAGAATATRLYGIDFDGTYFVSIARGRDASEFPVRYATAITGPWSTPSSGPIGVTLDYVTYHANGYWTATTSDRRIIYATDPTGTWSTVTAANLGFSSASDNLGSISWGNGYWVAAGAFFDGSRDTPKVTYLASTGSPDGTYAEITTTGLTAATGATGAQYAWESRFHEDYFTLTGSRYGEITWSYTRTPRPFPSPSGLPGNPKLRQRQTPIITK